MGTYSLETAEGGTIRIPKETDQARGTHSLEMAEEGTSQDTKRN